MTSDMERVNGKFQGVMFPTTPNGCRYSQAVVKPGSDTALRFRRSSPGAVLT